MSIAVSCSQQNNVPVAIEQKMKEYFSKVMENHFHFISRFFPGYVLPSIIIIIPYIYFKHTDFSFSSDKNWMSKNIWLALILSCIML